MRVISVALFVIMLCALNKSLFPKRRKYFNRSFKLGEHVALGEVCELSYECGVREGVLEVGKSSRQEMSLYERACCELRLSKQFHVLVWVKKRVRRNAGAGQSVPSPSDLIML